MKPLSLVFRLHEVAIKDEAIKEDLKEENTGIKKELQDFRMVSYNNIHCKVI